MRIELTYDDGAVEKMPGIGRIIRELAGIFSNPATLHPLGDPYAVYQVGGRINPEEIYREYWSLPRDGDVLRLVLTGYDLAPPTLNYSFGMTWEGIVSVVSTYRLESPLEASVIGVHELLHQIGLVGESQPQYDHRTGFAGHCRNRCIMRAANGPADLRAMVADWTDGVRLCHQCAST